MEAGKERSIVLDGKERLIMVAGKERSIVATDEEKTRSIRYTKRTNLHILGRK